MGPINALRAVLIGTTFVTLVLTAGTGIIYLLIRSDGDYNWILTKYTEPFGLICLISVILAVAIDVIRNP